MILFVNVGGNGAQMQLYVILMLLGYCVYACYFMLHTADCLAGCVTYPLIKFVDDTAIVGIIHYDDDNVKTFNHLLRSLLSHCSDNFQDKSNGDCLLSLFYPTTTCLH